jgi:signal transduction histidine kinase
MERRLDESREVMIFRIIQELVANIIKHSNASKAIIQLSRHDDQLSLAVEDDGIGFDVENATGGLGMKSLRSRVDYLKGSLQIESNAGQGTSVYIEIPA